MVAVCAFFALAVALQLGAAGSPAAVALSMLTPWIPALCALAVVLHARSDNRPAWGLIAAGMASNAVGDVVFVIISSVRAEPPAFSLADPFYLATYPFLLSGAALLVRAAAGRTAREAALDAATVASVFGLVIWQFLVVNVGILSEGSLAQRVVLALYPMADALLVAILCAVLLLPGGRSRALTLVGAFAALLICADVLFSIISLSGADGLIGQSNALYDLSYLMLSFAAFAAFATPRAIDRAPADRRVNQVRLMVLGVAMAATPVLALTATNLGYEVQTPVYIGCALAVSALVLVRLGVLVRGLDDERARLQSAERELAHRASHDELTGLPNRSLLLGEIERAMAEDRRSRRDRDTPHLLFIDLDDFKVINDSLGHREGDDLLREIGARIREATRPGDIVARLGGDEFVIFCRNCGIDDATRLAARVLERLEAPLSLSGHDAVVSASVGIASLGQHTDPIELVRDADVAMYEAKASGKARVRVFDASMRHRVSERHAIEQGLRRALEHDTRLWLAYQPRVDLSTRRIVGLEALARWTDEHGTLHLPSAFIPVAESTGLIVPIGAWALQRACHDVAELNRSLGAVGALGVSVNLSVREAETTDVVSRVARALASADLDPGLLTIEVTESLIAHDADSIGAVLTSLRDLGVRVEVDDFGVGYSSLSRLGGFPLDGIKIDRSFVSEIATSETARSVVIATIALAGALGFDVSAEGIETETQLEWLLDQGCTSGQGFLFERPVPIERIAALVTV